MKKSILVLFAILLTGNLFAYDGWSSGMITRIRIQETRILVNQENATNPGNCPSTDYLYLPQSDSAFHKNMYAALLTANTSGKQVNLALDGCSVSFPAISEVWIVE